MNSSTWSVPSQHTSLPAEVPDPCILLNRDLSVLQFMVTVALILGRQECSFLCSLRQQDDISAVIGFHKKKESLTLRPENEGRRLGWSCKYDAKGSELGLRIHPSSSSATRDNDKKCCYAFTRTRCHGRSSTKKWLCVLAQENDNIAGIWEFVGPAFDKSISKGFKCQLVTNTTSNVAQDDKCSKVEKRDLGHSLWVPCEQAGTTRV